MSQMQVSIAQPGRRTRLATALAWAGLLLALGCGVAELLSGLGYRWSWWNLRSGIQVLRWSATTGFAAAALTLALVLLALAFRARRAFALAALGLALSFAVVGPPLHYWRLAGEVPPIHDISTDTENPPQFVAVLPLRRGAPNPVDYSAAVATQQKQAYPDIVPAFLALPPQQAWQRAERAARAMGWDIVAAAPQDLRIEATDTTLLFGFKDDIVIRVAPAEGGSRIDVRSVSRVGKSDIGTNAGRIRKFMQRLAAA